VTISANARAWLDTIRMAEGTWHGGGDKGYGTQFGGGQFDWRKGHPDQVVRSGGYASAAAGAYQFMPDTWKGVTKQLGVDPRDFSPAAQDRAALQLMRNRGVNPDEAISNAALAKLAPEWASLPTAAGKSYYGQPVKGHGELGKFYQARLGQAPAQQPSTAPDYPTGGGATGGGTTGEAPAAPEQPQVAAFPADGSSSYSSPGPATNYSDGAINALRDIQSQGQQLYAELEEGLRARPRQQRMAASPGLINMVMELIG
jgi:muramidase (phage lysozyme)